MNRNFIHEEPVYDIIIVLTLRAVSHFQKAFEGISGFGLGLGGILAPKPHATVHSLLPRVIYVSDL
jgi:hypothetical protein